MNPFFLFLLQFCFPTVGRRLCTSSMCGIVHNKSRIGIISTGSLVQNPQGTPCIDTETTSMLIGVIGLAYWLHSEPMARQRFFQRKSSICISQAASFFSAAVNIKNQDALRMSLLSQDFMLKHVKWVCRVSMFGPRVEQ